MWDTAVNLISMALMAAGGFFMLSGALGILRMPDLFTRLHPAGVIDSLAAPLILLGVAVNFGFSLITAKIILLILLLLITNPTATHALCISALLRKVKPLQRDSE